MKTYLILPNISYEPMQIKADCVHINGDYTEFILNHEIVARIYNCFKWELLNETESS